MHTITKNEMSNLLQSDITRFKVFLPYKFYSVLFKTCCIDKKLDVNIIYIYDIPFYLTMSRLCSLLSHNLKDKNDLQFIKLFIEIRNISFRNQILNKKNLYDSLGVTSKATQNDIKSAYYKLSMLYHPDKNKDSNDAAVKFRDISEAYEVLGNFKLRKLYDKGIIHTADSKFAQQAHEPAEDDAQTKFYKQHMRRSAAPPASGRTPIYDFDEWSRNHYGAAFDRKQSAKLRYNDQKQHITENKHSRETIYLIFSLSLIITLFTIAIYNEGSFDNPKKDVKR